MREKGILTVAIVAKPFVFEGSRRFLIAQEAVKELSRDVDTLLVMPNQRLLDVVERDVSMIDAFHLMNSVLTQSVKGIADIVTRPGHINVDFADLRSVMKGMGLAIMGTGRASGEDRAREAALQAISSPLLESMNIEGARSVLLNISGGTSLTLHELEQAASVIYKQAADDATIILGSVIDETFKDDIAVTIIATGFDEFAHCEDSIAKEQTLSYGASHVSDGASSEHEHVHSEHSAQEVASDTDSLREHATQGIDVRDLDVPTFLRKKAMEEREE